MKIRFGNIFTDFFEGDKLIEKTFFYHSPSFRYNILAAKTVESAKNDKIAAKMLFDLVGLEAEKYRLGHTKVTKKLANKQWAKIW